VHIFEISAILESMAKERFTNLPEEHSAHSNHGLLAFLRWRFGFVDEPYVFFTARDTHFKPRKAIPDLERIHHPNKNKLQLTWIGHDTFLLQYQGINILTDPIFSKRASPFLWIGPKRLVDPGLHISELPRIDYVVVSHDHYDHLDYATVKHLGNTPKFIVPLGLKAWFEKRGITRVVEKNWWENERCEGVMFTAAPVKHFSGRVPFRFRTTLWTAWVIEIGRKKIFFSGDTGYNGHFKKVYDRFGAMDVALIPIGAYHPRWLMQDVHIDPREAVAIHEDLHACRSIAMHWGTFKLTSEPLADPPLYLQSVLKERKISQQDFQVLDFGEMVVL